MCTSEMYLPSHRKEGKGYDNVCRTHKGTKCIKHNIETLQKRCRRIHALPRSRIQQGRVDSLKPPRARHRSTLRYWCSRWWWASHLYLWRSWMESRSANTRRPHHRRAMTWRRTKPTWASRRWITATHTRSWTHSVWWRHPHGHTTPSRPRWTHRHAAGPRTRMTWRRRPTILWRRWSAPCDRHSTRRSSW